ncbi:kinase-like domain-containing protein, partial [Baffinella frigidus]
LGEGGFATVRTGKHKVSGRRYAIKSIDLSKIAHDKRDMLEAEVEPCAEWLPAIIMLLWSRLTTLTQNRDDLVMEECVGGHLFDFLICTRNTPNVNRTPGNLLAGAVSYLHKRHIAHRDIKPENFLLESKPTQEGPGEIKLIDFGFSKVFHSSDEMHNVLGSPYYVAPEVLRANSAHGYGPKVDIWSLGVVIYMMLCGCPPFTGGDNSEIYAAISKGEYTWPADVDVSDLAKDFIKQLLTMDPGNRVSAAKVL